jgi:hypothetical protein
MPKANKTSRIELSVHVQETAAKLPIGRKKTKA